MLNCFKNLFKNKTDISQLSGMILLKDLNKLELLNLSKYMIERHFKSGEMIYKENYPHVVLYFIISGKIEIFIDQNDNKFVYTTLSENHHFGEVGMFNESTRITSAKAITDCTLYAISKYDFVKFISKYPGTGIKLLFKLAESISSELFKWIKNEFDPS
ncbi:MAG TPA: cyclic nucleotide-binding domain-containing protein [Candidatus Cloacimonadota bacterium]|nr:cyclic nucleotide-binding domain-containing protein [Candidatus Cloacimonadota bacterium]